jgi:NADH dehydrogenase (ubiquinone) 1 alpha subcomplex subunit 5
MASAAKATTNLTRLAVAKNPHRVLGVLYSKSLRAFAKMPSDYAYRKHTEQIVTERAELTKATKDVLELEKKIGCGQIEEVIIQAQNELKLARSVLEWKSWEPLENEPPATQWKWPM